MTAVGYASTNGDTRKLNVAGGSMTGDLVLPDDTPDTAHSATSKAFVLNAVAGAGTGVASDTVVGETTFGLASTAGVSAEYSRGDHTHGTPAAPAGSVIHTNDVRITAGDVALTTAASWTIVTSGVTQLACKIDASVGDRLHINSEFMRTGSGFFLDLATLTSGGAISRYLGSGTSTPLPEGNPAYYPQSGSFPAATGTVQMIVAAGEVDGSGKVTVALVYRGSGTETVYDSATYPFYMLLSNLGPVPS